MLKSFLELFAVRRAQNPCSDLPRLRRGSRLPADSVGLRAVLHHSCTATTLSGFTLIELMLSIGLIAVLAGVGAPLFSRALSKNDLDTATFSLVESLRRSSILSAASDGDSTWGVKVQSGSIVLFKGIDFASRDTTYDEVYSVPTNMSFSGTSEYVMNKLTGYPQVAGSTTLASVGGDGQTVTINSKGMVAW